MGRSRLALRRGWVWWIAGAALLGLWTAFAFRVVPGAIRAAHDGEGLAILRRAMPSAADRPLAGYLRHWTGLARTTTAWLIIALVALPFVARLLGVIRSARGAAPARTPAAFADILSIALWSGLVAGIGEGLYTVIHTRVLRMGVPEFTQANWVTALAGPLAYAIAFGIVGLVLGVLLRGRAAGLRIATTVFAALVVGSWIGMTYRIAPVSTVLFAAGVGVAITRTVAPSLSSFPRYCRRNAPRLALFVVIVAASREAFLVARNHHALATLPSPPSRRNVLLIVHDTERAASMGLYGHSRPTTPFLDTLAERAVTFDLASAPSSWTLPSHGSLFTGRQSEELGLWRWVALEPEYTTLAEVLREAGYHTSGFAGNLIFLNPAFGLNQGFMDWKATTLGWESLVASAWPVRRVASFIRPRVAPAGYPISKSASRVSDEFLEWLDGRTTDRPWFAFLNYFDAHDPYTPAETVQRELLGRVVTGERLLSVGGGDADEYTPEVRERMRDAYEAEIAELDAEMRRLFAALEARGQQDSTVVVVTSDHGEQFGEHGLMGHENSLYLPVIHVPLLILQPGGTGGGTRVGGPVEVLDVGATILDLIGLPAGTFPGESLVPLWTTRASGRSAVSTMQGGRRSVLFDGWHCVLESDGRLELYRLSDPAPAPDLSASPEAGPVLERARRIFDALDAQAAG